jgi:hypothetical protein
MKRLLAILSLTALAMPALAECSTGQALSTFGHNVNSGGLLGALGDTMAACDGKRRPLWLIGMPSANGWAYCRQVALSHDMRYAEQYSDCLYWFGHSIEAP